MTRVALYCRVSTEEQAQKFGLGSQLTELRALANGKGYEIAEGAEFIDDGHSGADLERPALSRLRDAARLRAFEVLLVHDPDRLSRRLAHQMLLLEELERVGVRVEFLTTPREDTPEGALLLNVKAVISEYERLKIRERTSRGRREKARRGLIAAGPIPFGYQADPASPGRVQVDETEAAVVRMAFRLLVEEQRPIRGIVDELRRQGIRPRRARQWAKSSVSKLLASEFYSGQAFYNRRQRTGQRGTGRTWRPTSEWIPINVPAIISRETYALAQQQLTRNRELLSGRPGSRFYLLGGLLRCGECGRRLHGIPSHGRRFYRCAGRDRLQGGGRCRAATRSAEWLEDLVWETVTEVLRNPALLAEKLEAYRTRVGVREVEVQSQAEHLRRQLAGVERQEHRLLDLFLAEGVPTESVRDRLQDLARAKAGLRERLAVADRQAAVQRAEEAQQDAIQRFCAQASHPRAPQPHTRGEGVPPPDVDRSDRGP